MSRSIFPQIQIRLASCAISVAAMTTCFSAVAVGYGARALTFPQDVGSGCSVYGINDKAELSGGCYTADGFYSVGFSTQKKGRHASDFGLLTGVDSFGYAINAQGAVVGEATLAGDEVYHAVLRLPGDGSLSDLGSLGGNFAFATGINDKGQIVGYSDDAVGDMAAFITSVADPRLVSIGNTGGSFIATKGINNNGVVIANGPISFTTIDLHAHYAQPPSYKFVDLGTLGGRRSFVAAVNDKGVIVGRANFDPASVSAARAFIAKVGVAGMRDLGTPAGQNSSAEALNNKGQIVGRYFRVETASYNAFVCSGDCVDFADLNPLTTGLPSGVSLSSATSINDRGLIVATGTDSRLYLLTPK